MGHFYNEAGEPRHRIIGKNGKERNSTIADCRKNSWYPSVTTVLDILAKPSLDRWKHNQIANACYANPSIQQGQYKWTPEGYASEMVEKAFEQVDDAADLGTLIHEAIEMHFEGKEYDFSQEVEIGGKTTSLADIVQRVELWTAEHDVMVADCELRLVNKKEGYAGLTDAVITRNGKMGILDFKTRKTKAGEKCKPYDSEPTQIAAYHMARYGEIGDNAVGANLYISTTELGRVEACWYSADDLRLHWEKFRLTLRLWEIIKNYQAGQG
jgi:hypothetical protein